ncbi:hypothetical protein MNV49_007293 [Pseudohyphozyma bogoriensis]|nr:hypothetical protein MNV49_007293 [Pseudohyphozyma bogoriensis]
MYSHPPRHPSQSPPSFVRSRSSPSLQYPQLVHQPAGSNSTMSTTFPKDPHQIFFTQSPTPRPRASTVVAAQFSRPSSTDPLAALTRETPFYFKPSEDGSLMFEDGNGQEYAFGAMVDEADDSARGRSVGPGQLRRASTAWAGRVPSSTPADAFSSLHQQQQLAELHSTQTDLSAQLHQVSNILQTLILRVSIQEDELARFRQLLSLPQSHPSHRPFPLSSPAPSLPPYGSPPFDTTQPKFSSAPTTQFSSPAGSSKLQPNAEPFNRSSPPGSTPSTPPPHPRHSFQTPPNYTHTSSSSPITQFSTPPSPSESRRSSVVSFSPIVSVGTSSASGSLKRRSRTSTGGSFVESGGRARGVSFSAIAPVVAQARYLNQEPSGESLNYRALLEQDDDVDPSIFINRILSLNDQSCSLYLQQRLKSHPGSIDMICDSVKEQVVELSLNKFGNFLVSRCLEYGSQPTRQEYIEVFKGRWLQLSTDQYGCHVVQKALDVGELGIKDAVISEIIPHPSTLTLKHSAHVWSRILSTPNPRSFFAALSSAAAGTWVSVALEECGSLIVQSLLDSWSGEESMKSEVVVECGEAEGFRKLVRSQWGSFVAIHFIEHRGLKYQLQVLQSAALIAADTFGAKVLERTLRLAHSTYSNPAPSSIKHTTSAPNPHYPKIAMLTTEFIDQITQVPMSGSSPKIVDVAMNAGGAQLLLSLLGSWFVGIGDKDRMVAAIKKYGESSKHHPNVQKVWVAAMERAHFHTGDGNGNTLSRLSYHERATSTGSAVSALASPTRVKSQARISKQASEESSPSS